MIRKLAIGIIAFVLPASTAIAHPGHGEVGDGHTLRHYLTEPVHLGAGIAVLVVSIAVTVLLWRLVRSARISSKQRLET